ncbi:MAG: UDP-N-acetylmuramoyl-tripeptide--D-alanyl-D-alanine ligase [Draconibacterium sp.]|nr:MAG: UDP-N-acetylmuramoyl-tripeptide--D-alanyl-D-alanine ligase [Draconibacterium sp.]
MTSTEKIYPVFKKFPKVATDSRQIEKGSIFFALKGGNFNGNIFAEEALKKGAAYAVVDEKPFAISEKTILVDNALKALQNLASHHRKELNIKILAITGSNGKTTTKELISNVLSQKFRVSFTQGNLNNHIGVPLTLLKMNSQTDFGIVEIGANHPGEIAMLCHIANPDYGIITNIGKAHLEGFGSIEGVIKAKTELYDYLAEKEGTAFYNSDNKILAEKVKIVKNSIGYGVNRAEFTGSPKMSAPFIGASINFSSGTLNLNSQLIGNFNFENIMAAACIGNYFNVAPEKIREAIETYSPENSRSQLINKNDRKIIMDAYNANPTSMQASIKSFITNYPKEKTVILGDMLELGKYSAIEHQAIIDLLLTYTDLQVFLIGENFSKVADKTNFITFENVDQLNDYITNNHQLNKHILIKGSRGIRLEKVLEVL